MNRKVGDQVEDDAPVRLRNAVALGQPTGLADALAGASTAHQPTAAELGDLRRSLAVALAAPGASAPPSGTTPRMRVALRGAMAVALLTVGAEALWYGIATPTVSQPAPTGLTAPGPVAHEPAAPAPVAPAGTIAAAGVAAAAPSGADAPAVNRPPLELRRRRGVPGRAARRDDELKLLSRAQQALGSEPALSFALAERHRRLFPDGALAQEREVIAIEALRGLQKTNEAEARAQRFRARYPRSAHLPRVEGQRL
ncbi:MAG TPA: hypothetical protein VFH73_26450 [Polyangia bacterium]|jgi:hypothetical protein|nr:hypothetical protein [Polyangia bacterium]